VRRFGTGDGLQISLKVNVAPGAPGRRDSAAAPQRATPPINPSKRIFSFPLRLLRLVPLCTALAVGTGARESFSQSSFDTDPFAQRFREKGGFDVKFRLPEKSGSIRIVIDAGEEGGPQGKQTVVDEDLFTAEAPPGSSSPSSTRTSASRPGA